MFISVLRELSKELLPSVVSWLITFFMVTWLLDDSSFWLRFFLASALSGGSYYAAKISRLKQEILDVDTKINIVDSEVVRISPMVDSHDEKIEELERLILDLQDEISDLKRG